MFIKLLVFLAFSPVFWLGAQHQIEDLKFVRQGVKRLIFDDTQNIPLATLEPRSIVGMAAMHPVRRNTEVFFSDTTSLKHIKGDLKNERGAEGESVIEIVGDKLVITSKCASSTAIWFGGFNPFATYAVDIEEVEGEGLVGFEFSSHDQQQQFFIVAGFSNQKLTEIKLRVMNNNQVTIDKLIGVNTNLLSCAPTTLIVQLLGSGLVVYSRSGDGVTQVVGQCDFNNYIDLRKKTYISSFQSHLFVQLNNGKLVINKAEAALTTGVGLADIRPITYENGDPFIDQGRLWYTMSIRGRDLPHHLQGVFSMNPSVFDIKLEGIVLFDRNDGLLRNEIASHLFYDRRASVWRGLTTGFSAYANPEMEKKQLLAVESQLDPRFGISIMRAEPFGMVGDIEDPQLIYDNVAQKWRMLTCEHFDGYKAVLLESDDWNKNYQRIAGPVPYNSTGTSIQKIGDQYFCFSGSSDRKVYVYTYPDLEIAGTLQMDLPPWDDSSGTRIWPNVVQLPAGYPFQYVALMMDRYNFPGMQGPNWTYGALYLFHGTMAH